MGRPLDRWSPNCPSLLLSPDGKPLWRRKKRKSISLPVLSIPLASRFINTSRNPASGIRKIKGARGCWVDIHKSKFVLLALAALKGQGKAPGLHISTILDEVAVLELIVVTIWKSIYNSAKWLQHLGKKNLYSTISMAPDGWRTNTINSEVCETDPTKPFIGRLNFGSVENSICQGICCIITVVEFSTGNRRRTLSTEAGSLWIAQVQGKPRWIFWWLGSVPGVEFVTVDMT